MGNSTTAILDQISRNALLIQLQIATLQAAINVEGPRIDPEFLSAVTATASIVEAEATRIRQLTAPR